MFDLGFYNIYLLYKLLKINRSWLINLKFIKISAHRIIDSKTNMYIQYILARAYYYFLKLV